MWQILGRRGWAKSPRPIRERPQKNSSWIRLSVCDIQLLLPATLFHILVIVCWCCTQNKRSIDPSINFVNGLYFQVKPWFLLMCQVGLDINLKAKFTERFFSFLQFHTDKQLVTFGATLNILKVQYWIFFIEKSGEKIIFQGTRYFIKYSPIMQIKQCK